MYARAVGYSQPIDRAFEVNQKLMGNPAFAEREPSPSDFLQQLKRAHQQMTLEDIDGESAEPTSLESCKRRPCHESCEFVRDNLEEAELDHLVVESFSASWLSAEDHAYTGNFERAKTLRPVFRPVFYCYMCPDGEVRVPNLRLQSDLGLPARNEGLVLCRIYCTLTAFAPDYLAQWCDNQGSKVNDEGFCDIYATLVSVKVWNAGSSSSDGLFPH
ncbi:MAG: hypothetical protein M1820_007197 [Bogoriella megaspora]|nr:MAG: hypothetical protein M1820_007197 [Bogoriella megaspora]